MSPGAALRRDSQLPQLAHYFAKGPHAQIWELHAAWRVAAPPFVGVRRARQRGHREVPPGQAAARAEHTGPGGRLEGLWASRDRPERLRSLQARPNELAAHVRSPAQMPLEKVAHEVSQIDRAR